MRKSGDLGFRRRDPRDVDKSYDNAGDHILDRAVGQDPHDIALGIVGALDMLLHGEESSQDTFGVVLDAVRNIGYDTTATSNNFGQYVAPRINGYQAEVSFGDPATLIRRSQWHGIAETLDEESSAVERELNSWLVRYLQSEDGTPRTFQGHPGGWT